MTQQYTPVTWQDETTSQQGTLINAERLNQMQTAHHYADGFEEVDAVPTADPGVSYHKIVYCTADSTFYRWDGTEWTKDIDDETKALLQQEIARATEAEGELAQDLADETTARETADTALGNRITDETSARQTADTGLGNRITAEATARAEADTELGADIGAETARARQAEQTNAQAIANTYTKAEADTLLALKADQATTYTKTETDTLLALKANDSAVVHKAGAETIPGAKTFSSIIAEGNNAFNLKYDGASGHYAVTVQNTTLEKNVTPTNNNYPFYIRIMDKNGARINEPIGIRINSGQTEGLTFISAPRMDGQTNEDLVVHSGYVTASTRGYIAGNTTDVATIATLDAYTPMIRTTGNQTKAGQLTLTSGLILKAYQAETIEATNGPRIGTNPSATQVIMRLYQNAADTDYVTRDTVFQSANNRNLTRIWYLQRQNADGTGVEQISLSLGFTSEGRASLSVTDSQGTRAII